jgi:putative DNA primase/helicase
MLVEPISLNGHALEPVAPAPPSHDEQIAGLAALDPIAYDRARRDAAKGLDIRPATLDRLVAARQRSAGQGDPAAGGSPLAIAEITPWPEPVDAAAVLDEAAAAFGRYLALPAGAADGLALWVAFTYAFEAFWFSPRLAITSPEKQCGKTTLLTLLGMLASRPLNASNITAAAVFRSIELARPTLLIDEADTFLAQNDELRGILNAGHNRGGAVVRVVGEDHEPRQFSAWSPVAIAKIGALPDTLADRSITIAMRRRLPGETVARLRGDRGAMFERLRQKLARFAADAQARLAIADPETPAGLSDRAADNWRVLLIIADEAGGDWPERARLSCAHLCGRASDADETHRVRLLRDLKAIFDQRGAAKLASAELCDRLADDEAGPWAEFGRAGKPITAPALARLLKPFGVAPKTMRHDAQTWKGYDRAAFEDAWARYLADSGGEAVTP